MTIFLQTLGALGLFLLGMMIMSDGLRAMAGASMRNALMRSTRNPVIGAITGAMTTAILQSSSATTVAAVGFVSAGLIEFSNALGIIFGANIGTTVTGWLVAIIGFKLKLGILAMPLVFVGVLLSIFGHGRISHIGFSLAGFGLIFVSIDMMQQTMSGLDSMLISQYMPEDSISGRLMLVCLGMIATVITQSSSAGVAATLAILYSGAINFEQAAAIVIGMDVGTTIKTGLATIGASVGARRTGYSHIIYNMFTAVGALLLLNPYIWLWQWLAPGQLGENAEIALVAFHSSFNILGVIAVLPVTRQFAAMMKRIIKDPYEDRFIELDTALLKEPSVALTVVQQNLYQQILTLLSYLASILEKPGSSRKSDLVSLQSNLDKTHAYIDHIHMTTEAGVEWQRLVAVIHTLDHMHRLHERCEEDAYRATVVREASELTEENILIRSSIKRILEHIINHEWQEAAHEADQLALEMYKRVEPVRERLMAQAANGSIDLPHVTARLQAIRWLERVSKHIARICHHYGQVVRAAGK